MAGLLTTILFISIPFGYCYMPFPVDDTTETVRLFQEWRLAFNKTYRNADEMMHRYEVFVDNLKRMNQLNQRPVTTFDPPRFGPNQFADLTPDEFKSKVLLSNWSVKKHYKRGIANNTSNTPETFDWTEHEGVVTPVKNQGEAGTCWAFTSIANIEGLWTLKTGKPSPSLSSESLVDCDGLSDTRTGAIACGPVGGLLEAAYQFIKNEGGVMTEKDYPYCLETLESCFPCEPPGYNPKVCGLAWPIDPCKTEDSCAAKYDPSQFVAGLKVRDYVLFKNEEILEEKLIKIGPLAAGIDAADLMFYQGGILSPMLCDPRQLNHAVLLVGYDDSSAEPHWRAKNSWGDDWGEKGYLRIQKGINACGIGSDVSTAVLE